MTAAVLVIDAVIAAAVIIVLLAGRGPGHHVRPIRIIPVSRRVPPGAAGRAPGRSPSAGAPEALAPDSPVPGAGASPQSRPAAPGGTAPASPGGGPRRPWVTVQDPPGTPRGQRPFTAPLRLAVLPGGVWDGSRVRELAPRTVPADGPEARGRQTGAQPALVRGAYEAYEAWRDAPWATS